MNQRFTALVPLGLVSALVAGSVFGDATLEYRISQSGQPGTTATPPAEQTRRLEIRPGFVRVDTQKGGRDFTILFNREQSALIFVNHYDKLFTMISEEWMTKANDRTKKAMEKAKQRISARVESLPPDQRAQAQQGMMGMQMISMMGGFTSGATQALITLPNYTSKSINGLTCRGLDIFRAGRKIQQTCVADNKQLKLDPEDLATLSAFTKTTNSLRKKGAFVLGFAQPEVLPLAIRSATDLVVEIVDLETKPVRTVRLQEIKRESVRAERMLVPEEYLEARIPLPSG